MWKVWPLSFALPEQANATNHNSGIDECLSLIGNIPAFLSRFGEGVTGILNGDANWKTRPELCLRFRRSARGISGLASFLCDSRRPVVPL
jgi:hypothetical protein